MRAFYSFLQPHGSLKPGENGTIHNSFCLLTETAIHFEMEEPMLDKLPSLCHTPKDSGTAAPQGTGSGKQVWKLTCFSNNVTLRSNKNACEIIK